jgi:osmotically-inducible protein OsmY
MSERAEDYQAEHVREALAADPRVNAPELQVRIGAGIVHVDGVVPTHARRAAIEVVVQELCPGFRLDDRTTVAEYGPDQGMETIG